MSDYLPHIEHETGTAVTHSIIWLHGLGADGHDFEPIMDELRLTGRFSVRFIFPHAPTRAITINAGRHMPAWYDFQSLNLTQGENREQIETSVAQITAFIAREIDRGIAPRRILLAGFSQGGVIALHSALRYTQRLGGVIALSTYLALPEVLLAEQNPVNKGLAVFSAHGTEDPVIPFVGALHARDWLREQGYTLQTHDYTMAHSVCPKEIEDIRRWVTNRLGEP